MKDDDLNMDEEDIQYVLEYEDDDDEEEEEDEAEVSFKI